MCADCIKFAAQIPSHSASEDVAVSAYMLVYFDRCTEDSLILPKHIGIEPAQVRLVGNTKGTKIYKPMPQILPHGKKGVVDLQLVRLFMAWATAMYKVSGTIESTLSAIYGLAQVHKS